MTFARTDEQRMLADQLAGVLGKGATGWDGVVVAHGLDLLGVPESDGGLGTDIRDGAVVAAAFGRDNTELPWAEHWAAPQSEPAAENARTLLHCAEQVGLCETMLRDTALFMRDRKQFGVAIAKFQALRHRMADMAMLLEQARAITDVAIDTFEEGERRMRAVSAARVICEDAARAIGEGAVQIHGAMGLTDELRLAGFFRRSRALMLRDGGARRHLRSYAA
ncbi:MAG: acyl-CoA dehydrogenase family protein [Pseudomonadota bacterium]